MDEDEMKKIGEKVEAAENRARACQEKLEK
jgi:hypothetical protein